MRSNNLEPNARLCMSSAVMGFMTQFQSDEPMGCYDDLELADDFVLWGNNMAEMHPVLFSRILETKRQKPARPHHRHRHAAHADLRLRRPARRSSSPTPTWRWPTASCTCSSRDGRIDEAFIDENVVFKRGIEDVEDDRLRLLRRPGRAIHVRRRAARQLARRADGRSSHDYTPEQSQRDHRRAGAADRGARRRSTATAIAARSACGAWA